MIELILLQASPQPTDTKISDWLMRGAIGLLFTIVGWGIKIIYEVRKNQANDIKDLKLNQELIKKDVENSDKLKEALDKEYIKDFNEVKAGVKSLISTVGEMKLDMVEMKSCIKHLEEHIH
jgi:hypothetical protein